MMSGTPSRNSCELLPQHQLMSGSVPALSGRDPGTVIRPPDPIDASQPNLCVRGSETDKTLLTKG